MAPGAPPAPAAGRARAPRPRGGPPPRAAAAQVLRGPRTELDCAADHEYAVDRGVAFRVEMCNFVGQFAETTIVLDVAARAVDLGEGRGVCPLDGAACGASPTHGRRLDLTWSKADDRKTLFGSHVDRRAGNKNIQPDFNARVFDLPNHRLISTQVFTAEVSQPPMAWLKLGEPISMDTSSPNIHSMVVTDLGGGDACWFVRRGARRGATLKTSRPRSGDRPDEPRGNDTRITAPRPTRCPNRRCTH